MQTIKSELDLSFKKQNTTYSTHGIHTWVASMIPLLAKKLIEITEPKTLLDPYCGGGTVCVEGVLAKIPVSGIDVNPLAILITSSKTTKIRRSAVMKFLEYIISKTGDGKKIDMINPDHVKYWVNYWFKPHHRNQINQLATLVDEIPQGNLKTFFQCVLSATVRACSLTYKNEIRLRRFSDYDYERFNPDPVKLFEEKTLFSLERINTLPAKNSTSVRIKNGSAMNIPFKNNEFSTIICSPPYGDERNGVSYFQFAKNMLYWLGLSKEEYRKSKHQSLGWYTKENIIDKQTPNCKTVKRILNTMKTKQNCNDVISFYSDYEKSLSEMVRVTTDKIVIVIGNRIIGSKVIDNGTITTELMDNYDMRLTQHYVRDLPSKRLPRFGDTRGINGGCIDKEDILIYSHK